MQGIKISWKEIVIVKEANRSTPTWSHHQEHHYCHGNNNKYAATLAALSGCSAWVNLFQNLFFFYICMLTCANYQLSSQYSPHATEFSFQRN